MPNEQINQESFFSIYGPVKSWRAGTSLGIDPIGEISTCSFNCVYCQLGKIQNVSTEIKIYQQTTKILHDFNLALKNQVFNLAQLDVITFAGSGEPSLALNLGEVIDELKKITSTKISVLTNATTLNDARVRDNLAKADLVSLKLDAPNDHYLQVINQAHAELSLKNIIKGIKALKSIIDPERTKLQLQIMFLEKFAKDFNYIHALCQLINEIEVFNIQINTPTRPKPISKSGEYWLATRGNHYGEAQHTSKPDYIELTELPCIDKETAFAIEAQMRDLLKQEAQIINVYAA